MFRKWAMTESIWMLFFITLMILFCSIKFRCWFNLCHDGALYVQIVAMFLWNELLFSCLWMIKYSRSILGADVRPLTVILRRFMRLPKNVQELFIAYFFRVIFNLYCFSMASLSAQTSLYVGFFVWPPV